MEKNEQLFYDTLKDIFIGAKIEGDSGFVNLMKIKSSYFDVVFKELKKEIDEKLKEFPDFKEEMYGKLKTFFSTYFSESGSIYFTYTPLKSKIYDRIYTNQDDVILFWKTKMLYYVKTDKTWHNVSINYDKGDSKYTINFDVSKLEHKSGNEKKEVIYQLKDINTTNEDKVISFYVLYSEKGKETDVYDIRKKLKENKIYLDEEDIEKIFKIFEKQNEVDYFINKDAKSFLKEQFDLWLKNYVFGGSDRDTEGSATEGVENDFSEKRIRELKTLKEIAYKIIDFVSQFEDELVKIWNKPKFVLNSNYVITLDRIANKNNGIEIIKKILNHEKINDQIKEWKDLGIIDDSFDKKVIIQKTINGETLNPKYKFLPIDTKYFKDLELDILSLFDNLDKELDGWLIHSENYQALNTILPKFNEKVQTIYIDPPYNTGSDEFIYNDKFQHSSWLTMMENRLRLAKDLLRNEGVIFVSIDDREQENLKSLMKQIFGNDKFLAQIIRDIPDGTNLKTIGGIKTSTEYVTLFLKEKEPAVNNLLFKDPVYLEIVKNEISDFIETRLTKRGNSLSDILFPKGIGKLKEGLNVDIKEGNYINPSSREKILLKKGDLIINNGILQKDVVLEAPWSMPNVLKELFAGKEVYDDSGQKYENVFFKNNGIPYIVKSRGKTLIPSYLEVKNKTDELFLDIFGYEESLKGATVKPVELIYLLISFYTNKHNIILDFFAGSGTTAHAVMKLNKEDGGKRKFILVEMADYFNTIIIPRIKKLAFSFNWKNGKPQDNDGISTFVKYYDLEQYEQTLRKCHYIPSEPFFNLDDKSVYEQYVFLKDPKLLDAMELDYKNDKIKMNFDEIYSNIDIAETLSNSKGKWIKKITKDSVVLVDDNGNEEEIRYDSIDFKTIKPLIWW